jgi:hypothetical protein
VDVLQDSCKTGNWDADVVCHPGLCPQPGACCYTNGRCETTLEDSCGGQGQAATPCAPIPCSLVEAVSVQGSGPIQTWRVTTLPGVDGITGLAGHYRAAGAEAYASMWAFQFKADSSRWEAPLTDADFHLRGLEYYLQVSTVDGAALFGDPAHPRRLGAAGAWPGPPLEPMQWRMVSAPMAVAGTEGAFGLLAGLFGPPGPGTWKMGWWDPMQSRDWKYVEVDEAHPRALVRGQAYWLGSTTRRTSWELAGQTAFPAEGDSDFAVVLKKGWNMVGNPAAYPVTLDREKLRVNDGDLTRTYSRAVSDLLVSDVYVYAPNADSNYVTNLDSLATWEGCFIRNLKEPDLTLLIPAQEYTPRERAAADKHGKSRWSMPITVESSPERARVRIELAEGDSTGLDADDELLPPAPPDQTLAVFLVSGTGWAGGDALRVDARPVAGRGAEWWLVISNPREEAELTWPGDPDEQRDEAAPAVGSGRMAESGIADMTMFERGTERRWDMRRLRSVDLPRGTHWFRIAIEWEDGPARSAEAGRPGVWIRVGPNPLRDAGEIRYGLVGPGPIEVEIFDVHGALIWEHRRDEEAAGEHAILWNVAGSDGKPLPGGEYFARLKARNPGPAGRLVRTTVKFLVVR